MAFLVLIALFLNVLGHYRAKTSGAFYCGTDKIPKF
jgi:hypothetical protein